ncbi:hypothetical protein ALC53_12664 [Atta colombica]|uniref:Uncharacterized protein n=1 Tax=Atta colombica TaxID=520822 RepID=A0A151HYX7_9HYME|nr:hypothetical protein ALC53_12664 [Atta colombica]
MKKSKDETEGYRLKENGENRMKRRKNYGMVEEGNGKRDREGEKINDGEKKARKGRQEGLGRRTRKGNGQEG